MKKINSEINKKKNDQKVFLILMAFCIVCLKADAQKIDKKVEDGVEVVMNHLEPYKAKGEPSSLILQKEFSIDLAQDNIAKIGLAGIYAFDVDSEGNIYIVNWKTSDHLVFKFDKNGDFIMSFGRRGQGPGELQWAFYFGVDKQDNIIVSDSMNRKIVIFDKEGKFIREAAFPESVYAIYPLENGKYLAYWRKWTAPTDDYFGDFFSLYSADLKEIKTLDTCLWPNPRKQGIRGTRLNRVFNWKKSGDRIYVACENRGYEFLVYDLDGRLLKKIRKEYKPVKVEIPEEDRKKIRAERPGLEVHFPESYTPFGSFFLDDEGRLFVQTYESKDDPGTFIYDIFNDEGVFIGRTGLNVRPSVDVEGDALAKKGNLCCIQETERGFEELAVYKMIWKH